MILYHTSRSHWLLSSGNSSRGEWRCSHVDHDAQVQDWEYASVSVWELTVIVTMLYLNADSFRNSHAIVIWSNMPHRSQERIVYQLHYEEWPDHGVPDHTENISTLISKVQSPIGATLNLIPISPDLCISRQGPDCAPLQCRCRAHRRAHCDHGLARWARRNGRWDF